MKVFVSIGDFSPVLRDLDYLFRGVKASGADGVELWIGIKSRFCPQRCVRLSEKYDLPINSLHQPLWSMLGLVYDKSFFDMSSRMGVSKITCHPLPNLAVDDARMDAYFSRLASEQQHSKIEILIENLPRQYRNKLLHIAKPDAGTGNIEKLFNASKRHNLGLTFDTDHLNMQLPQDLEHFDAYLPSIKNIHLSSFSKDGRHLTLDKGDLQVEAFLSHLKKHEYTGDITLEVTCPKSITLLNYDFPALQRSIAIVKSI